MSQPEAPNPRLEALGAELASTRRALHKAQLALSDLARGTSLFERRMQEELAVYRRQRAWRVMLWIRAAYDKAVRRGLTGKLSLLGGLDPDSQELAFPALSDYISPTARELLDRAAVPPACAGLLHGQRRADIIVLPIVEFDFRFQRPQQLAIELARRGHRVFWLTPARRLPPHSPLSYETVWLPKNLHAVRLQARPVDIYREHWTPSLLEEYLSALREFYRDWAITGSILLVQFPFWRQLALRLRQEQNALLLYDSMDDWDTFHNVSPFARAEESALAREADILTVSAHRLEQKFSASASPVLVRNAVDFDFYRQAPERHAVATLPKPVIGYFGAIADWFDLPLVECVVRSRPQYNFVFIGQVFHRDTRALAALPNVRLIGAQPYESLPGYLRDFDVCLIPFLLNQVTEATDPVKLYEYFAYGKPVVSTPLPELAHCGDMVYTGRDAAEFAARIDQALAESDPALTQARLHFAASNTWAHRATTIDEAVRAATPLISILLVTHNSAEFLRPCLASIARNTFYPNYEVILFDNASTDSTPGIARQAAARDPRIRFIASPANEGFARGNNHAAAQARGQYLVLLNADTLVTPGWLARLRTHLLRDPKIGLVCAVTNFSGNETKVTANFRNQTEMEAGAMERAAGNCHERSTSPWPPCSASCSPGPCLTNSAAWTNASAPACSRMTTSPTASASPPPRGRRRGYLHPPLRPGLVRPTPLPGYEKLFETNRRAFEAKWNMPWTPHKTRPGVHPAFGEPRIRPPNSATCSTRRSRPCPPGRSCSAPSTSAGSTFPPSGSPPGALPPLLELPPRPGLSNPAALPCFSSL